MTVVELHPDWGIPEDVCPKCGGEYESRNGMESHFKRAHSYPISFAVVSCDYCGDHRRMLSRNNAKGGETHFCSDGCQYSFASEHYTGAESSQWSGGKESKECEVCGATLRYYSPKIDGIRTCGGECKSQLYEQEFEELNSEFLEYVYASGEESPTYDGGYEWEYYGPNWQTQREKAKRRDGYSCRNCGKLGPVLDCHHIIPYDEFDSYEEANSLENLVTYCRSCHMNIDGRGASKS